METTYTVSPPTFKAFQYTSFGDAFEQVQLNTSVPQAPLEPTQVRIKVHSAATNPIDLKIVAGKSRAGAPSPSVDRPAHYGFDLSGTVVEVGRDVPESFGLHVNAQVFAMTAFDKTGAFAEYICMDAALVATKPKNVGFNEAAALPLAAQTSLQALVDHGQLQSGQRVLILGGSGGTGTLAVQMAKAMGAYVITTSSARNAEMLKLLGADEVIDYTTREWVDEVAPHSVDLVYDCGKEPNAWKSDAQRVLKPHTGRFVTILAIPDRVESPVGATAVSFLVQPNCKDLIKVAEMVEDGKLVPVLDSIYQFEQLAEALKAQAVGRAKGKIVVQVAGGSVAP